MVDVSVELAQGHNDSAFKPLASNAFKKASHADRDPLVKHAHESLDMQIILNLCYLTITAPVTTYNIKNHGYHEIRPIFLLNSSKNDEDMHYYVNVLILSFE